MKIRPLNIFGRNLMERKWTILIYCISGILLILMYIVFFPSIQKSSVQVSELVKNLPESLVKSFGLDAQSFTTFEGFVAGKHYSLVWPILVIALSVSLASSFFAGEIEKGTIEILLAQPISRTRVFLEKFFAGALVLLLFIITSVIMVIPMARFYNIGFRSKSFLTLGLLGFLFTLSIFGLSLFFSCFFSEKNKVFFLLRVF